MVNWGKGPWSSDFPNLPSFQGARGSELQASQHPVLLTMNSYLSHPSPLPFPNSKKKISLNFIFPKHTSKQQTKGHLQILLSPRPT